MKMSQCWKLYVKDKILENYSNNTLKSYLLQCRMLVRYTGDIEMNDIELSLLKEYLLEQKKRLKISSYCHRVKFMRAFFRWCFEEGYIEVNLSRKLKMPKSGVQLPKFVNEEYLELLRIHCKKNTEGVLLEFLYSSGARIGEVYNLNKSDINLESRSVIVKGKGNKEREIYFSKRAEIWIKRYFDDRQDNEECFIVSRNRPYRRMSIDQMRNVIKVIAKRAKIDESIYPHKLRHTYATHLINNDAPLDMVRDMLGHKKMDTTKIYAHLRGDKRKEQYRKYFSN